MTDASWPLWWNLFRDRPGCIKGATRRAVRSAMVTFVEEQDMIDFERQFVRTAERVVPNLGAPALRISQWVCGPCQKAFRRKAGLAVHMFKVHGRTAAYHRYDGSTKCPGCGTDFHHYQRILVHIRDTPDCAKVARASGRFCGEDLVSAASSGDKIDRPIQFFAHLSLARFVEQMSRESVLKMGVLHLASTGWLGMLVRHC